MVKSLWRRSYFWKKRAVWEQFGPHFNWNTSLGQNACKRMLPRMLAKTQAHWLYPQLYIIGTDVDVGLYGHQGSQSYLFCNQIEEAAKQTTPQPTRLEILITWDGFYWKLMGRIGSNHLLVIKVISLRFNMSHCKVNTFDHMATQRFKLNPSAKKSRGLILLTSMSISPINYIEC